MAKQVDNLADLMRKGAEKDEFERASDIRIGRIKANGPPTNEAERAEFMEAMRKEYAEAFKFLETTAVGVIPDDKRHQLIAEGHKRLAQLEQDFGEFTAPKLRYWQYPHLWPVLALIVGLIVIAANFGGAS